MQYFKVAPHNPESIANLEQAGVVFRDLQIYGISADAFRGLVLAHLLDHDAPELFWTVFDG